MLLIRINCLFWLAVLVIDVLLPHLWSETTPEIFLLYVCNVLINFIISSKLCLSPPVILKVSFFAFVFDLVQLAFDVVWISIQIQYNLDIETIWISMYECWRRKNLWNPKLFTYEISLQSDVQCWIERANLCIFMKLDNFFVFFFYWNWHNNETDYTNEKKKNL